MFSVNLDLIKGFEYTKLMLVWSKSNCYNKQIFFHIMCSFLFGKLALPLDFFFPFGPTADLAEKPEEHSFQVVLARDQNVQTGYG